MLQVAYEAACRTVPAHRHKYSPHTFTQRRLMACLVLKEFLRLDSRGLVEEKNAADRPQGAHDVHAAVKELHRLPRSWANKGRLSKLKQLKCRRN